MRILMSVVVLVTGSLLVALTSSANMETAFKWRYIDYNWPSKAERSEAIRTGAYNTSAPLPMDVDVSHDGRVFLSMEGGPGVPARLGYVTKNKSSAGPLLQPYPDWSWHQGNDCDTTIKEVLRVSIDKCNRLWVLDTGSRNASKRLCQPKVLVFDLNNDSLISRIILPDEIIQEARTNLSLPATIIVETHGYVCHDTTVYIADANGNALIVWNRGNLYRLESSAFWPEIAKANVTVGRSSEYIAAGIVGMDISPRLFPGEPRFLYFRPIASYGLYAASVDQIKESTLGRPLEIFGKKDVLSSQSIGHAFSSNGTLFLGLTKEIAIACWNRYRELKKENIEIVAQDSERLQYADGIKVIRGPAVPEEELWVLSNRHTLYRSNQMDFKDFNFYVLRSPVRSLIAGTKCELPKEISDALIPSY